jgi:hypothetical protein
MPFNSPSVVIRQDLAALPSNLTGYIADKVLPPVTVATKSGARNWMLAVTGGSATTSRTPSGTVTRTIQTSNIQAFTTVENRGGFLMDQGEIANFGTQDAYEAALALTGVKQVRDQSEARVVAATIGVGLGAGTIDAPLAPTGAGTHASPYAQTTTDIHTDLFIGLHNAVLALRPFGKVAIFGGVTAINTVRQDPTVIERMRGLVGAATGEQVRSINAEMLAQIFEADAVEIAITLSAIWPTNRLGVIAVPELGLDPIMVFQAGRRLVYNWALEAGAAQPLICKRGYDPATDSEFLDVVAYDAAYIANGNMIGSLSLDGN